MKVHHINRHNFREEVLKSEKPVLLDFWAPWCSPCNMFSPVLEEIAAERQDLKVCKVNIDEEYDLASGYKVISIPTLLILQEGRVEDKFIGFRPKEELLALLG